MTFTGTFIGQWEGQKLVLSHLKKENVGQWGQPFQIILLKIL